MGDWRWRLSGVSREVGRYRLLARLRKLSGVGVEVGTWRGDSAARFLRWVRPERLFLVDVWRHSSAGGGYQWAMYARTSQTELDDIYAKVLRRFQGQIEQGQVVVKREPSLDAAKHWSDASVDWAYIDADHTYDAVLADLEAYWRILKPGGLLAGDDYGLVGWWKDGVTQAVGEFARVHQAHVAIMGSQFLIEKPSTPDTR